MIALFASAVLLAAPAPQEGPVLTSGRPLTPEQECFDVFFYRLDVKVDPAKQSIEGEVLVRAHLLAESKTIALDLDDALTVSEVGFAESWPPRDEDAVFKLANFTHEDGRILIPVEEFLELFALEVDDKFSLRVRYGGVPRVAPRPPWDGGFVWEKTPDGYPWVATANQMQGADLWWPCKDQPGDEPESMLILVTIPDELEVATNGRLQGRWKPEPGWETSQWLVSTPINTYGVALNIAPYETITEKYQSTAGETFPITYWVLHQNYAKGEVLMQDILKQTRFFEETFGPYPFRRDKYGVAETPHLGMEHQTITAYGNEYRGNPWGDDYGFDFLHHHEMAHEWWANLVTARDWKDFWIHEGFATYAQALYVEHLKGEEAYREWIGSYRDTLNNELAVAPREHRSTADVYGSSAGSDIYYKGAWILHTLRWVLGDEKFFVALRRMAYPEPELEKTNDGSACRFTDTEEIRSIAEKHGKLDLGWFFEVYLRQPALPRLMSEPYEDGIRVFWEAPDDLPFPMPVEARIGQRYLRFEVPKQGVAVRLGGETDFELDPNDRILRAKD